MKKRDPSKSIVYAYRPGALADRLWNHYLAVDGKEVAAVAAGSYYPVEVAPGAHTVSLVINSKPFYSIAFTARAGEEYFLRSNENLLNLDRKYSATAGETSESCGFIKTGTAEVLKKYLEQLDTRIQKEACTTKFMFVERGAARREVRELKLSLED